MKISKITQGLVLLAIASGALVAGCELIVDFDRTRIPIEGGDATIPDSGAPTPDSGAPTPDSGTPTTDAGDAGDISDAADDG
jgi:hypothetical protein